MKSRTLCQKVIFFRIMRCSNENPSEGSGSFLLLAVAPPRRRAFYSVYIVTVNIQTSQYLRNTLRSMWTPWVGPFSVYLRGNLPWLPRPFKSSGGATVSMNQRLTLGTKGQEATRCHISQTVGSLRRLVGCWRNEWGGDSRPEWFGNSAVQV